MRFDLTKEDIEKEANELIIKSKAVYDAIGSLKPENVTFENVVKVNIILFY